MFHLAYRLDHGPRVYNHDAAAIHVTDDGRSAWAIADGIGAHSLAGEAAWMSVHTATSVAVYRSPVAGLLAACAAVNEALDDDHANTTLVVAAPHPDGGYAYAWVGDSRLYELRDGDLVQLTVDHNEHQAALDLGTPADTIRLSSGATSPARCSPVSRRPSATASPPGRVDACCSPPTASTTSSPAACSPAAREPSPVLLSARAASSTSPEGPPGQPRDPRRRPAATS
ncbi:PP2C family protein-serine/threonine phosphatase [Allokutzneria oryzae]|uniref:Protein phosphatase 2C domain-containing protein n=1 Tax=Allokutzneria oryzae TaxID=1378989 RepID=A0ABV5ZU23_9PSEU